MAKKEKKEADQGVDMGKRIITYRRYVDDCLENNTVTDWEGFRKEHLVQIQFFQHERTIHLMVTLTFAILTVLALSLCVVAFSVAMIALLVLFLILLVPYLHHYWVLENETQRMYRQYDKITAKLRSDAYKD